LRRAPSVKRLSDPALANVPTFADFVSFYRYIQREWVHGMCVLVGVSLPSEDTHLILAACATAALAPRGQAALPGAVEAIRTLHGLGYSLHTASESASIKIAGYLEGLGLRDCFGCCYGADVINTFKDGPAYCARPFADAGISPAEAVVVGDSSQAVAWMAQSRARVALVRAGSAAEPRADQREPGAVPHITALADLPAFLQHRG
jgi:beta-phosphoglucomutase-like phosphatase (HAD superfamily)